jgi:hypothetical protein
MNKEQVKEYFALLESLGTDFFACTRNLTVAGELAVWEVDLEMTLKVDLPGVPFAKGERGTMQGCSLVTWEGEKIVKVADYFCWVKKDM